MKITFYTESILQYDGVGHCLMTNTPFTRSSWLDELARRDGYVLAGRASSMFARRLLDACWISARRFLDICSMSARCSLDRVNGV